MRKVQNYIISNEDVYIGLEDSKKTWKLCIRAQKMEIRTVSMQASYSIFLL